MTFGNRLSVVVICLALVLIGAACSPDDDTGVASLELDAESGLEDSTDGFDASSRVEVEEAILAYSQCLRDQGFDIPDPTFDANGIPQFPSFSSYVSDDVTAEQLAEFEVETARMEEAVQACRAHLDGVVMPAPDTTDRTETEDAVLEYAACMRSNGIDMPDPDYSSSGGVIVLSEVDAGDDEFEAADKVCRPISARSGSDS